MAVVQRYSNIVRDPAVLPPVIHDSAIDYGRVRASVFTLEVTNGDSVGSEYFVADVPSNAVMLPNGSVFHDAIGAGAAADFGDANDPNGLFAAQSIAAAGSQGAMEAVDIVNYGKKLWELLGYASDPGGKLALKLTLTGAAAADGTISGVLLYTVD